MKISLAWLYDHIELQPTAEQYDEIAQTVFHRFARSTAEIDQIERLEIPLAKLFCMRYERSEGESSYWYDAEHNREVTLSPRPDSVAGEWYLIFAAGNELRYATYQDLHGTREGLLPFVYLPANEMDGSWRAHCDPVDYRITIDNQAFSHRPDLWGHRGIAREVAAIMGWKLRPLEEMIAPVIFHEQENSLPALATSSCDRLVTLSVPSVRATASPPWMLLRLIRLATKPINLLVDATNYVMFDIGQPLHAFDADRIQGNVRMRAAAPHEALTLLDGASLKLTARDCVVADDRGPLSLAGIMGGEESGVGATTRTLLIEAAHFSPAAIRHSATAHHIRTESSTRFEKDLDPALAARAVARYLLLLQRAGTVAHATPRVAHCWGSLPPVRTLMVTHAKIEAMIGITLEPSVISAILNRLELSTQYVVEPGAITYQVAVPSFRLHDIQIAEDIIEEIVRIIGYDTLPSTLPQRPLSPASSGDRARIRQIRHHIALSGRMQEIYSYPLYDEAFLRDIGYNPSHAITLKNPVSENWQRLVTSLVPHLLKAVVPNLHEHEEIRLFEINTTWRMHHGKPEEKTMLAFVVYAARSIDFYEGKQYVESCAELLRMPLEWHVPDSMPEPWYRAGQTAALYHTTQLVGYAGMVAPEFLKQIAPGSAFVVELDAQLLASYRAPHVQYKPISKYPTVIHDISILAPYQLTVAALATIISQSDTHIDDVALIDTFAQPSWQDKRALTFRITLVDYEETMTKELIEQVMEQIHRSLHHQGATIR